MKKILINTIVLFISILLFFYLGFSLGRMYGNVDPNTVSMGGFASIMASWLDPRLAFSKGFETYAAGITLGFFLLFFEIFAFFIYDEKDNKRREQRKNERLKMKINKEIL